MSDAPHQGHQRFVHRQGERADGSSDVVVERAKVREVAGVLPSRIALDAAVESLLLAGFDRADIDVLDRIEGVHEKHGIAEELADAPQAPRRPYIAPEDVISTEIVVTSVLASVGAIGAAFVVVSSGGGFGWAMIVAAGAALIAGGVAFLLMTLYFRQRAVEPQPVEALTVPSGFVLWVRVRTSEQEDAAKYILTGYGAQAVRLHEIEIVKRPDDVPLSSLRPDPWLGDERLGDT
jgi:hypothetical protein